MVCVEKDKVEILIQVYYWTLLVAKGSKWKGHGSNLK
jgi:hypothetical protein